ncbi:DUF551 domain-containing protein [Klebsiella aerogenes]
MTNNHFSREELLNIIETDHVQCGEASALARMALAAMDSEPVAYMYDGEDGREYNGHNEFSSGGKGIPLYRHAQQPVVPETAHSSVIAEQLAHVLSGMDVTDHQRAVISCAVDRLNNVAQLLQLSPSALLVPEILDYQGAKELYNYLMTEEETNATVNGWNACRAAMLQAEPVTTANKLGNSPVIGIDPASVPDRTVEVRYVAPPGFVLVPKEPTEEMNKAGWAAMNEHDAINPTYRAMLAAAPHDTPALNSVQSVVTVSDTWIPVSERMPENDVSVLTFDGMYKRVHHAMYGHWQCWEPGKITHWMPLPAAPQEVIGIDLANGKDASVEVVIENGKVISHG